MDNLGVGQFIAQFFFEFIEFVCNKGSYETKLSVTPKLTLIAAIHNLIKPLTKGVISFCFTTLVEILKYR